jgi:hypothetical protein
MPLQSQDSPLGAFLKALRQQKIDWILVGAMAAIEQSAPLMTVDYDFWVLCALLRLVRPVAAKTFFRQENNRLRTAARRSGARA